MLKDSIVFYIQQLKEPFYFHPKKCAPVVGQTCKHIVVDLITYLYTVVVGVVTFSLIILCLNLLYWNKISAQLYNMFSFYGNINVFSTFLFLKLLYKVTSYKMMIIMVDRVQENPKYKKTKKQEICITGFKFSTHPLHAKHLSGQ